MKFEYGTLIVSMELLAGSLSQLDMEGAEIFQVLAVRDCMALIIYRRERGAKKPSVKQAKGKKS